MRLAAVLLFALAAAPAVAQQAPQREIDPKFAVPAPGQQFRPSGETPPPEGFYRSIPSAYDLLLRLDRWPATDRAAFERCTRPDPELTGDAAKTATLAYQECLSEELARHNRFLYRTKPRPKPLVPSQPAQRQ